MGCAASSQSNAAARGGSSERNGSPTGTTGRNSLESSLNNGAPGGRRSGETSRSTSPKRRRFHSIALDDIHPHPHAHANSQSLVLQQQQQLLQHGSSNGQFSETGGMFGTTSTSITTTGPSSPLVLHPAPYGANRASAQHNHQLPPLHRPMPSVARWANASDSGNSASGVAAGEDEALLNLSPMRRHRMGLPDTVGGVPSEGGQARSTVAAPAAGTAASAMCTKLPSLPGAIDVNSGTDSSASTNSDQLRRRDVPPVFGAPLSIPVLRTPIASGLGSRSPAVIEIRGGAAGGAAGAAQRSPPAHPHDAHTTSSSQSGSTSMLLNEPLNFAPPSSVRPPLPPLSPGGVGGGGGGAANVSPPRGRRAAGGASVGSGAHHGAVFRIDSCASLSSNGSSSASTSRADLGRLRAGDAYNNSLSPAAVPLGAHGEGDSIVPVVSPRQRHGATSSTTAMPPSPTSALTGSQVAPLRFKMPQQSALAASTTAIADEALTAQSAGQTAAPSPQPPYSTEMVHEARSNDDDERSNSGSPTCVSRHDSGGSQHLNATGGSCWTLPLGGELLPGLADIGGSDAFGNDVLGATHVSTGDVDPDDDEDEIQRQIKLNATHNNNNHQQQQVETRAYLQSSRSFHQHQTMQLAPQLHHSGSTVSGSGSGSFFAPPLNTAAIAAGGGGGGGSTASASGAFNQQHHPASPPRTPLRSAAVSFAIKAEELQVVNLSHSQSLALPRVHSFGAIASPSTAAIEDPAQGQPPPHIPSPTRNFAQYAHGV